MVGCDFKCKRAIYIHLNSLNLGDIGPDNACSSVMSISGNSYNSTAKHFFRVEKIVRGICGISCMCLLQDV